MLRLKISVTVILTPPLPHFPSVHLHSLAHLRGKHKGAESLWNISIVIVSPLQEHQFRSVAEAAAMLIGAMFLQDVASEGTCV